MKQRGVHNVFHASLLRIHIPNDDRLFPGRLDTQLSLGDSSEGEWAVDKILSHTGAKDNSIFKVQLRTTKVNKFVDRFIETGRDFLKVRKPSE